MPVPYKLYQNTRAGSKTEGKWYARATHYSILDTDKLASQIESATTLTKPDIVACIAAFLQYIRDGLRAGQRVKLDKFGSFKVGMATTPADSAKDFSATSNVKSLHVIFQPAVEVSADGKRTKSLLSGVKVEEMHTYNVDKEQP
jgi:predicted histone-like DNA-binding protein